jgi:hypothetical protein
MEWKNGNNADRCIFNHTEGGERTFKRHCLLAIKWKGTQGIHIFSIAHSTEMAEAAASRGQHQKIKP